MEDSRPPHPDLLPSRRPLAHTHRPAYSRAIDVRRDPMERDAARPDPDSLPDGSGTDPEQPDDGEDTASGGGADDR